MMDIDVMNLYFKIKKTILFIIMKYSAGKTERRKVDKPL